MDALRIANGIPAFGVDSGPQDTPAEAGLAADASPRPGHRVLVRLELRDEEHAVVSGEPVILDGNVVGYVTSAAESLTNGRFLAFAWVDPDAAAPRRHRGHRLFRPAPSSRNHPNRLHRKTGRRPRLTGQPPASLGAELEWRPAAAARSFVMQPPP